jgi:prepilin-type N-terminal cleavage/methylation domain-containing protein
VASQRRWRRFPEGEGGYSLTELLVAMGIFSIVMVVVSSLMIDMTNMSKDTLARVRTLEEAKLGISQIDRQVRSGNVILDPASENETTSGVPAYFSMRIYTQADGTTPRCAQWRVIDKDEDTFGNLEYRTWLPGYPPTAVTSWSVVARNLVKMDFTGTIVPADPSTWPPFWVDNTLSAGTQAQFVRVTLRLKDPNERADAKPSSVTTVVTGRNTIFGYPAGSCANAPDPDAL